MAKRAARRAKLHAIDSARIHSVVFDHTPANDRDQSYIKKIRPRSDNQRVLMEAIEAKPLTVTLGPAGTAHASVGDVATYLGFLLRGGVTATGTRLVSEAALAELFAPRPGSGEYGLGWVAHDDDGDRAYYHDGSNTLFYSSFVLFPERGLAIAVLTNRGDEPATLRVAELRAYLIERFVR